MKLQLGQFIGTEHHYFDPFFGKEMLYTDGVKFLRDNEHNFLISDILIVLKNLRITKEILPTDFIFIEFKKNKKEKKYFEIIMEDEYETEYSVYTQTYDSCLSEEEIKFFFINNVLMLSSEY